MGPLTPPPNSPVPRPPGKAWGAPWCAPFYPDLGGGGSRRAGPSLPTPKGLWPLAGVHRGRAHRPVLLVLLMGQGGGVGGRREPSTAAEMSVQLAQIDRWTDAWTDRCPAETVEERKGNPCLGWILSWLKEGPTGSAVLFPTPAINPAPAGPRAGDRRARAGVAQAEWLPAPSSAPLTPASLSLPGTPWLPCSHLQLPASPANSCWPSPSLPFSLTMAPAPSQSPAPTHPDQRRQ